MQINFDNRQRMNIRWVYNSLLFHGRKLKKLRSLEYLKSCL